MQMVLVFDEAIASDVVDAICAMGQNQPQSKGKLPDGTPADLFTAAGKQTYATAWVRQQALNVARQAFVRKAETDSLAKFK